jgi:hypothetical protein
MAGKFKFDFTEVKEKMKAEENKGFEKDDRFWRPVFKDGVSSALIRFLPAPDMTMFVKYQDHSFDYIDQKKEKKRYWKKCLNSLGKNDCPICKKSWEYHESAFEQDKKRGKELCRKEHYITNIYVIKHAARPEDEGKTFLYDMAPVIKKYNQRVFPSDADKAAPDFVEFIPCDFYDGADFFITTAKNGEFANGGAIPNYAESRFMPQSAFLNGNDDKIEEIFNKVHALDEFRDPSQFPSNEEVLKLIGHYIGMAPEETSVEEEGGDSGEDNTNFFNSDDEIPEFNFPDSSDTKEETKTDDIPFDTSDDSPDNDDAYFNEILNK